MVEPDASKVFVQILILPDTDLNLSKNTSRKCALSYLPMKGTVLSYRRSILRQ